jgi:two-component system, OmpR family, sensor kinase
MSDGEPWFVVLDPAGAIVARGGGAPADLVGKIAMDLEGDLGPLALAARGLVEAVRRGDELARATVSTESASIEVVALPMIAVTRSQCDLAVLTTRAIHPFKPQADAKDVALTFEGPETMPFHADEAKILWSISTLVGNALRFSRAGTRRLPGGAIRVSLAFADACATITVRDDGPGIDAAHVTDLFLAQGGAVALRMVRDIASAHGGRLEVVSSIDVHEHGTTIALILPVATISSPEEAR